MIKTGFKKTKMFGLVGFIGLFVSLGLASTVNADETQPADVTVVAVTTDDNIQVDNKPSTDINPSITVYGDPNEDHTTVVEFTTDDGIQVDNKPSVTTYDDNTTVVAFETNDNIATDNKAEVITNGTDETVENAERGTINTNSGEKQGNIDTTPSVETKKTNSGSGLITSNQEQPIGNVEVPDDNEQSGNVTTFQKDDDIITVKNPEVDMHFAKGETGNGTGKYVNFKVEYKNIHFPDSMTINPGDKVVFHMPKEVSFRTNFDFEVTNPSNEVVGHANTNREEGTVTTTFNDMFQKNPINKQMSMVFDAIWTDTVTSGKEVRPNFDGTIKKVFIDPEPEVDPTTEKFSKWGSQAPEDPQIMRWTFRLNLAKQKLEDVLIKDRWTNNQKFVDGSLETFFVDDVKTWSNYTDAKEYLESFHVLNDGFDLKMKTFNRILYVNYRTHLITPVKDSTDPVNVVWATNGKGEHIADNYHSRIALAGGKGQASSENIPTPEQEPEPKWEIPHDAPKVKIPEWNSGIPGIPEVHGKPELIIPNESEKPIVPSKSNRSQDPKLQVPNKPQDPESVDVSNNNVVKSHSGQQDHYITDDVKNVDAKEDASPSVNNQQRKVLPNTGDDDSVAMVLFGVTVILSVLSIIINVKDLKK